MTELVDMESADRWNRDIHFEVVNMAFKAVETG